MRALRLYLDADVSAELAVQLRDHQIDATSALEARRLRAWDAEQLAFAAAQRRAILTHNRDDFVALAVEYFEQDKEHYGIIIAPQYELGELVRRVIKLTSSGSAEDVRNQIRSLQAYGS